MRSARLGCSQGRLGAARSGTAGVPAVEEQRVNAVTAEPDVDEPGAARVGCVHDQRHVVERRPGPAVAVDPGGHSLDLCAQGLQHEGEGPVELVAEAAAPPVHDLVDQDVLGQGDRLGQVDAQVFEGPPSSDEPGAARAATPHQRYVAAAQPRA